MELMNSLKNKYGNEIIDFADLQSRGVSIDFLKTIFSMFVDEITAQVTTLETALADKDYGMIESAAHTIKGSSANVGAMKLSKCAKVIEGAGADCDLVTVAGALPVLKEEIVTVLAFFSELFDL